MRKQAPSVNILGIDLKVMDSKDIDAHIDTLIEERGNARIFTPNAEILYRASKDKNYTSALRSATLLLPDGIGLVAASHILGQPLSGRNTGIDTAERLLMTAAKKGLSVFLLGGKEGVAQTAAERLMTKIAGLKICGVHHGYFDKAPNSLESTTVCEEIKKAEADILFVCFGSPEQEKWICENCSKIPSLRLSMGLGGSLDVWSGNIRRAPSAIQATGLEWLYRVLREPRRILRLPALFGFGAEIMRQAAAERQSPFFNKA